ncbi:MAG: DUF2029 domain-containing protein [Planctomycetales bacterium]|nr:DUF2029 domain-containing protein [Planctomycetales bacterium]
MIAETGCDFYALYEAGYNVRHGFSVYEHDPSRVATPCHYSFRYWPSAALVGVPLSFLSPGVAYAAWIALIELALFACLGAMYLLCDRRLTAFAPVAASWLMFSPLFLEWRLGQYSLMQAALVTFAAFAYRTERPRAAAASFAASLVWKLNTWIAAPALIRARRFAPLIVAAIVLLVTGVPHFMRNAGSLQAFLANLSVDGVGDENGFTRGNLGLAMLLKLLIGESFAPWMVQALFAACIGVGVVVTWRARHLDLAEQLTFWLALSLAAYRHTWEHHYVMALPALGMLLMRRRDAIVYLVAALLALPTPYHLFRGDWTASHELVYHAVKPVALLALLVLIVGTKKARRPHSSQRLRRYLT